MFAIDVRQIIDKSSMNNEDYFSPFYNVKFYNSTNILIDIAHWCDWFHQKKSFIITNMRVCLRKLKRCISGRVGNIHYSHKLIVINNHEKSDSFMISKWKILFKDNVFCVHTSFEKKVKECERFFSTWQMTGRCWDSLRLPLSFWEHRVNITSQPTFYCNHK